MIGAVNHQLISCSKSASFNLVRRTWNLEFGNVLLSIVVSEIFNILIFIENIILTPEFRAWGKTPIHSFSAAAVNWRATIQFWWEILYFESCFYLLPFSRFSTSSFPSNLRRVFGVKPYFISAWTWTFLAIDSTKLVDHAKDSGVIVDSSLSFSVHINKIVLQVFIRSNFIRRCFVLRHVPTFIFL